MRESAKVQTAGRGVKFGDRRRIDRLAGFADDRKLPAYPEIRWVAAPLQIDDHLARRAGHRAAFHHARTEKLVPPRRAVGTFGQTISKRPTDVDPEFPAFRGHRRILTLRSAARSRGRPVAGRLRIRPLVLRRLLTLCRLLLSRN